MENRNWTAREVGGPMIVSSSIKFDHDLIMRVVSVNIMGCSPASHHSMVSRVITYKIIAGLAPPGRVDNLLLFQVPFQINLKAFFNFRQAETCYYAESRRDLLLFQTSLAGLTMPNF